ncbi:type II toxin-antitoxin system RelE/ParE family toxin [Acholeplasma laidlawii]|nr:type II toxin-antitoxin system RelE/ParE family toxin [Acholeplasma laidlawii]
MAKILTNDRLIKKYYAPLYSNLISRLTELRAVRNLSLISHNPPPRKHKLTGKYEGCWSIDLSRNYRLIFTVPDESKLDENDIDEILILDIVDTH